MKRDEVIATLRQHRAALEERGVMHAAVFGSVARGEETAASDIDIMIDIEPEKSARMGIYDLVDIELAIGDLFHDPVDVVERDSLKRHVKPAAVRDAVYAF